MYIISLLNENKKKKKKKRTDISSRLEITQQPIILQSHCSDPLRAGCGTTIAVSFNILPGTCEFRSVVIEISSGSTGVICKLR